MALSWNEIKDKALNFKQLNSTLKLKNKILLSIGAIILGWILNAFAWATTVGYPISTICLLLGLGLFFWGLIFLISNLSKRK